MVEKVVKKFACGKCEYQATKKSNLVQHQRAVHDGVKYPCGECGHQATSKGHLNQQFMMV